MTNNVQGNSHKVNSYFLIETLKARREQHDIFKVMKVRTYNQDYATQQGSHSDSMEKIKSFIDKQKLREISTTKPALQ